jgi:cytochrome c2
VADELDQLPSPEETGDPIAGKSLSGPMLLCCLLLFGTLLWAVWDEVVGTRPWKAYQRDFVERYTAHLKQLGPQQAAFEKKLRSSPEVQRMLREIKSAEDAIAGKVSDIDRQLGDVRQTLAAIQTPFQDARARIAALGYELDHAESEDSKKSIRADIEEIKRERRRLNLPGGAGIKTAASSEYDFNDLQNLFNDLKAREARLNMERTSVTAGARGLRAKLNEYLSDRQAGPNQEVIDGLLRKMEEFEVDIKQIHVEEAGLIDRCESCHIGIREPITLTAADMGGQRAFVSHPNKTLLALHDPTRFGCSPCHNGNGLAVSSAYKAHGKNKHWLWPLFARENSEAGCLQCHFQDRVLEYAPVLSRGRDLYEIKGCIGCHRYEGYDRESDALAAVRQEVRELETMQKQARLDMDREIKRGDAAESNEQAQKHFATAEILRVKASEADARLEALERRSKFLMQDQKKIGPNLKDVRLKLRKEWIPVWLKDTHAFRPNTKMPKFRLSDQEVRALSAFVWQAAWEGPAPETKPTGDVTRGKESFETRGCLGCHSVGEGNARIGGEFAANLSRLGEKASYDYIVRWIHNPRDRTRPYCPHEGRDLGPEDYTKHGLKFEFSLENSRCPNDGHELQVQNMTVMPTLRLSWEETQDIATYLMTLKRQGASYPQDVAYMDDPKMAQAGRDLINRYGCGSCHEIKGFENVQRIGTELTKEASKPLEQLDFGLLEHQAKREGWYTHKAFIERKLKDPALYDQGREKAPEDRLRMPNIALTDEDHRALTTFLVGSMDSPFRGQFRSIPEQFRYIPTDRQKDVQDGWWVIKKYNCMGCHTVQVGQKSVLSTIPRYQHPDWKEQLPPSLIQEGARVTPEWLTHFLANPALDERDTNRNGVRTYLAARMPTFHFSPNELAALVRFFQAAAGQPIQHFPTKLEPLTDTERQLARSLFSSQAAPCLKCHLYGEPSHDKTATAPNFLDARGRLKPGWTARWMLDPQAISPGTAMPSGLFRRESDRWVFAGPVPESFKTYTGDHVQLLVRYMFELSPEEQRRLVQTIPRTAGATRPARNTQIGGGPASQPRRQQSTTGGL